MSQNQEYVGVCVIKSFFTKLNKICSLLAFPCDSVFLRASAS